MAGNYLTSRSAKRIPTEARVAQKLSHKERYLQAEKEAARGIRIERDEGEGELVRVPSFHRINLKIKMS